MHPLFAQTHGLTCGGFPRAPKLTAREPPTSLFFLRFFLLDILRFFDTRREKKNLQVIFACRMKGGKQAAIINLSIYRRKRRAWRTPACATHFEMLSACGRKQPLRGCGASSQEQLVAPLQRMLECFLLA